VLNSYFKHDYLLSLFDEIGLSRLTSDEKLKEAFSPFGQIVDGKGKHNLVIFAPHILP
jgi:RNA recognition motif-containing protein